MKKLAITLAFLLITSAAYSITPSHENKLLMKAMVEGATTQEQKVAVAKYLNLIAGEKQKQADSYRQLAQLRRIPAKPATHSGETCHPFR